MKAHPLFLWALAASTVLAQTEEPRGRLARAVKVVPVPHLVAQWQEPRPLPFGTMIDARRSSALLPTDLGSEPRIGDLEALLRDLAPLAWNSADASVNLVGDTLVLAGSPDQLHIAEQTLLKISACVGEPFRIQATVFSLADTFELPSSGASYGELRARLGKLQADILGEYAGSAASGQIAELGGLTSSNYVRSTEVEIAQSAAIAAPVVRPLFTGAALHVQPHALAGTSDLVLMVQYARGHQVATVRQMAVSPDEQLPQLQVPQMAVDVGTFSGRIKNGGALLLMADGSFAGRRIGVLVGAERNPVSADLERELGLFPISAFASPALRKAYGHAEEAIDNEMHTEPLMVLREDESLQVEPFQAEALGALFTRALGSSDATVRVDAQRVVVRGQPGARQAIGKLIEALQEQFLRTLEVDARLLADGNDKPAQSLRFPALLGRNHAVVHGEESTAVASSDSEVAQKSSICSTRVVRTFAGSVLCIQAHGLPGGELGARVTASAHTVVPGRAYQPGTRHNISLDQSEVARCTFRHAGRVAADAPLEFGEGPRLPMADGMVRSRQRLAIKLR